LREKVLLLRYTLVQLLTWQQQQQQQQNIEVGFR
jgi:hypothetical protein